MKKRPKIKVAWKSYMSMQNNLI